MNEGGNGARVLHSLAWPILTLLALVMLCSVGLVGIAFVTAPTEVGGLGRLLTQINALSRVAALIIVVPAVVVLTLLDKVEGSAAVAILSAVIGYIFGSLTTAGPAAP